MHLKIEKPDILSNEQLERCLAWGIPVYGVYRYSTLYETFSLSENGILRYYHSIGGRYVKRADVCSIVGVPGKGLLLYIGGVAYNTIYAPPRLIKKYGEYYAGMKEG